MPSAAPSPRSMSAAAQPARQAQRRRAREGARRRCTPPRPTTRCATRSPAGGWSARPSRRARGAAFPLGGAVEARAGPRATTRRGRGEAARRGGEARPPRRGRRKKPRSAPPGLVRASATKVAERRARKRAEALERARARTPTRSGSSTEARAAATEAHELLEAAAAAARRPRGRPWSTPKPAEDEARSAAQRTLRALKRAEAVAADTAEKVDAPRSAADAQSVGGQRRREVESGSRRRERAVVDAHLVDQPVEPVPAQLLPMAAAPGSVTSGPFCSVVATRRPLRRAGPGAVVGRRQVRPGRRGRDFDGAAREALVVGRRVAARQPAGAGGVQRPRPARRRPDFRPERAQAGRRARSAAPSPRSSGRRSGRASRCRARSPRRARCRTRARRRRRRPVVRCAPSISPSLP